MDSSIQKTEKAKVKAKNTLRRLDIQSAKLLAQLAEKANKKDFGRKIRENEILNFAVKLVKDEHLKELQEKSLSERDQLNMAHQEYQKKNGKISIDQFIGKLLKGEISPLKQ